MPKNPEKKKKISNKEAVQIERAQIVKEVESSAQNIRMQVNKLCNDTEETFAKILATFRAHEDILGGILAKMTTIDEMMSCVLVAVRQNEYLQTYYPAQHGFPEGKYVGIHPAKLEGVKK